MAASTARKGGPMALIKSSFFLKMVGVVVAFVILGFLAPLTLGENEFIGVLVGMSWSLAILMALVMFAAVLGTAVRSALR